MLALFSLIVLPLQLFAAAEFNFLRYDETIPEYCHEMAISNYQLPAEYFYVGREGAAGMGFTFEYPIKRSDATVLWNYFKSEVNGSPNMVTYKKIQNDPALKRDYDIIRSVYKLQDFDFGNEGEILEILAIHRLYEEFPENTYFITGGVEYYNSGQHTLGELDIYVGRRDNCEVVAIGESKLGKKKTLNKAKKQLQRFSGFLAQHNAAKPSNEYVPKVFTDGEMRSFSPDQDAARQCAIAQ